MGLSHVSPHPAARGEKKPHYNPRSILLEKGFAPGLSRQ